VLLGVFTHGAAGRKGRSLCHTLPHALDPGGRNPVRLG
jgi:hypothetical protein